MKILAIETSCDDTAVAVVDQGRKVLCNVISSQAYLHEKTGGVVPEVAAREHLITMLPVLDEALEVVGCSWEEIEAIAVTKGPGLISSLIVGTETASVLSYVKGIPLIPVQHITGHLYSCWLDLEEEPQFPILALTVSGGHNELVLMRGHGQFEVLGETLDDAAGEAFDKVARLLGLGYPGGPAIAKVALEGNAARFDLPRAWMGKEDLNFSFSGLKTAVRDLVTSLGEINDQTKADIAASFQEAVCDVLSGKLLRAFERLPEVKEVHLVGGVSANLRLRELVAERIRGVKVRWPEKISYCTDNAAMIACAGYYLRGELKVQNVVPDSGFDL